jgi:hypothetical protein
MRVLLLAAMISMGLVASPLAVQRVGATISACGGCPSFGPIIYLSDGATINTSVQVNDTPSDTQSIAYTLYVPAGVYATSWSFQGSNQASQSLQVVPSFLPPGTYMTTTYVTTGASSVWVAPQTIAKTTGTFGVQTCSTGVGTSNSPVSLTVGLGGLSNC